MFARTWNNIIFLILGFVSYNGLSYYFSWLLSFFMRGLLDLLLFICAHFMMFRGFNCILLTQVWRGTRKGLIKWIKDKTLLFFAWLELPFLLLWSQYSFCLYLREKIIKDFFKLTVAVRMTTLFLSAFRYLQYILLLAF